jgi:hypothetical protein
VLVLGVFIPGPVAADTPLENHAISRDAFATLAWEEGCASVSVYVSSSSARYVPAHGDGGGIVRQGLTTVGITIEDLCSSSTHRAAAAAGGGGNGGATIADWFGQSLDELIVHGAMGFASIHASVPVTDSVSGAEAIATVDLTFTATGPDVVRPSHVHLRYPFTVVVNTNSNDVMRDAVAVGTLMLDGTNWTPEAAPALLTTTRFHCRQIGFAQMGSDWGQCY